MFVQGARMINKNGLYVMMKILQIVMGDLCLVWLRNLCVLLTQMFLVYVPSSLFPKILDADSFPETREWVFQEAYNDSKWWNNKGQIFFVHPLCWTPICSKAKGEAE